MQLDTVSRFNKKVIVDVSGCHIWQGSKVKGYGNFKLNGKAVLAHRLSYEWAKGKIPDNLVIDHLCRTPACVNPQHLRAVTRKENTLADGSLSVSKAHKDKTHCINGHPFSGDNLIVYPGTTKRVCRKCRNAHSKKARHAAKGC